MTTQHPDLRYHTESGYLFAELPPEWKEPLVFDDFSDLPESTVKEVKEWLQRQGTKLTIQFYEDTDPTAADGSRDKNVYWFTRARV
jgi:hypothetical protein